MGYSQCNQHILRSLRIDRATKWTPRAVAQRKNLLWHNREMWCACERWISPYLFRWAHPICQRVNNYRLMEWMWLAYWHPNRHSPTVTLDLAPIAVAVYQCQHPINYRPYRHHYHCSPVLRSVDYHLWWSSHRHCPIDSQKHSGREKEWNGN